MYEREDVKCVCDCVCICMHMHTKGEREEGESILSISQVQYGSKEKHIEMKEKYGIPVGSIGVEILYMCDAYAIFF